MKCMNIIIAIGLAGIWIACSLDAPSETRSVLKIGDANFSKYVALGDDITAGFQSSALTEIHQNFSFANLIAKQSNVATFVQPLLDYPGVGLNSADGYGIQELTALDGPVITDAKYDNYPGFSLQDPYVSDAIKNNPAPYNNLAIPLTLADDILNATSSTDWSLAISQANPFCDIVLRNPALGNTTPFEQAQLLQPTFVTCWIGTNDVFLYAAQGGATPPILPTSVFLFNNIFTAIMDALSGLDAQVVIANIPDVTIFPLFTTISYLVDVPDVGTVSLIIHAKGGIRQATENDLILLTASTIIGDVSGDYGPAGVPVGLDTRAPLPDAFVLDSEEVNKAKQRVLDYNNTIASLASERNIPVVDIYTFYNDLTTSGYTAGGQEFSTDYIAGGLFSLDGAHPSDIGSALIANEFIKVINENFNAQIPLVNIIEITDVATL